MKAAYSVTLEQQPAPREVEETIISRGVPILLEGWDAVAYRMMRIIEREKGHETYRIGQFYFDGSEID